MMTSFIGESRLYGDVQFQISHGHMQRYDPGVVYHSLPHKQGPEDAKLPLHALMSSHYPFPPPPGRLRSRLIFFVLVAGLGTISEAHTNDSEYSGTTTSEIRTFRIREVPINVRFRLQHASLSFPVKKNDDIVIYFFAVRNPSKARSDWLLPVRFFTIQTSEQDSGPLKTRAVCTELLTGKPRSTDVNKIFSRFESWTFRLRCSLRSNIKPCGSKSSISFKIYLESV